MKRTPIKKANAKRRASEFQRCYGSKARVQFVQSLPCLVDDSADSGIPCGRSENAHVPSQSGAGRKGDACHVVSLCHWHHIGSIRTSLHALNKDGFNAYHGIDLDAEAVAVERAWTAHQKTLTTTRGTDD